MGRHMGAKDLDTIFQWKAEGSNATQVYARLCAQRRRQHRAEPGLSAVRRALKGKTFKRSKAETRGRKKKLSAANLKKLEKARLELIKKADSEYEVIWDDVVKKARVPPVHRTTAANNMAAAGYDVKWRAPRLKPLRGEIDEEERKSKCDKLRRLPDSHWQHKVDCYMDNKKWKVPLSKKGKRFIRMLQVRGHLRKPSEGLKKGFTKPNIKKHNVNTGATLSVCAAIIGGRVRVWQYLPKTWCAQAAVDLYKGVIAPALLKHRGKKRSYIVLEDNDPTGYKSNAAKQAKKELNIKPVDFPAYSPDLDPLDFSLWTEVRDRMDQKTVKNETAMQYSARLRRTALSIPEPVVRKMLGAMKARAQSIYDHNGGHIPRD